MDEHARRVLEYDRVLGMVARDAHWPPGREEVLALGAAPDLETLRARQVEVREAIRLQAVGGVPTAGGLSDVRDDVAAAGRGMSLQPLELLAIREVALLVRQSGRYFRDHALEAPNLARIAEPLEPFPRLEKEIREALSVEGRVLDGASPRLAALRRRIGELNGQIQARVQSMLRQSEILRMLQDPIATTRLGRHVLPVKAEYRGVFPGLVIDQSSSGATLFMEPWSVVEAGNELKSTVLAEEKEVEAILGRLSALVAYDSGRMLASCAILGHLDAVHAQASFARDYQAALPTIVDKGALRLVEARHPLLLEKDDLEVVPISLELQESTRTVVITGPNTGGKTVALKTVGLLAMLALSGLPIPAGAASQVPFLTGIYADIGDEQGIAQNLSTFSSHLVQVLHLLPEAGPRTLVMLDELGAGTDPAEGGALGKALMEWLHARGTLTVVTTHLSELKAFAAETEGMTNAAVEFNTETLRPTYRILMGVSGQSNALQIASRLGLPDELMRRAREHLGHHREDVGGLLDVLDEERHRHARQTELLRAQEAQVEAEREAWRRRLEEVEAERGAVLQQARDEGEVILARTREATAQSLQELRTKLAELQETRVAELQEARRLVLELAERLAKEGPEVLRDLSQHAADQLAQALTVMAARLWEEEAPTAEAEPSDVVAEELLPVDPLDEEARVQGRTTEARLAELARVLDSMRPQEPRKPAAPAVRARPAELKPGARVYVRSFGQDGEVVRIQKGVVEVKVGRLSLKVPENEV
ncbi:MAG: endonuclease MutS2, partial [Candidatus Xenobia bacterium]